MQYKGGFVGVCVKTRLFTANMFWWWRTHEPESDDTPESLQTELISFHFELIQTCT